MSCDVLIVEDEESIAMAVRVVFSHRGISTREAHTGEEALQIAGEEHPAVVLLDVRLPDMDGWDVCRRLKSDWSGWQPTVVFLTAATQETDRELAEQAGGDEFVAKPFRISELLQTVQRLLAKHQPQT